MNEMPLLMSGPMVRSTLEDQKTNTRRVIKPQPVKLNSAQAIWKGELANIHGDIAHFWQCPYGNPGDRLWVRENFAYVPKPSPGPRCRIGPDGRGITWQTDWTGNPSAFTWKPSIHMPRWASRITLEIVRVSVERVQDISEEDAVAEGVFRFTGNSHPYGPEVECLDGRSFYYHPDTCAGRVEFNQLWDSLNAERGYGWDENPWVWVIAFKRLESEVSR